MNKEHFSKFLLEQKEKGRSLLSLISTMHESRNDFGDGMAMFGGEDLYYVPEDELDEFTNKFSEWKTYVSELLKSQFGIEDQFVCDWDSNVGTYISKREPILPQLKRKVNKGVSLLNSFMQCLDFHIHDEYMEEVLKQKNKMLPPMVFISHADADKKFANEIVTLLEFIGIKGKENLLCTSLDGYRIPLGCDIIEYLRETFSKKNLFVIILHTQNYYTRPVCMNEMGAAWALKTKYFSVLAPDFRFGDMTGVVNSKDVAIKIGADDCEARINQLKNELVEFFGLKQPDEDRWPHYRSSFIENCLKIEFASAVYDPIKKGNEKDLFEKLYIPAFDHIFEMLDLDNFHKWAYSCSISGNTMLSASIYEKIGEITSFIKSRPKHKEYTSWDSLIQNLGLLLNEFEMVFWQHAKKIEDEGYIVEPFYKRGVPNPYYEEEHRAYIEHINLVSDMIFELARLCNLILSRIREIYPEYKKELGMLHVNNRYDCPDLVYRESEISDAPYPGLKQFIKLRLTRETHLGGNANINASGYETKCFSY